MKYILRYCMAFDFSTSAKYSSPSMTGMRMMLINEVALGECLQVTKTHTTLTQPPEGYHSVQGVKTSKQNPSDFQVCMI